MTTNFTVTNENYFAPHIMRKYWSVSQFKSFDKCEAAALAELDGTYQREETTSLLIGSYVDAYFSGEYSDFVENHPEIFNSRTGELKADYRHAEKVINRIQSDAVMSDYLRGLFQAVRTGNLFGLDWKIKIDVLRSDSIVDLKVVKDFDSIYEDGYGRRSWIEYWSYDIQGAIYQRIEQQASGRAEPLPFIIAAATKEKVPDIALIQIPQHVLDAAYKVVESKIERFELVKSGEVPPIRCGHCDYCKQTKTITRPEVYDPEQN